MDRYVRIIAVGFGVVLTGSAIAAATYEPDPQQQFCTAEGRIGPNGEIYGRDPTQGCQFVDEDGNVLP